MAEVKCEWYRKCDSCWSQEEIDELRTRIVGVVTGPGRLQYHDHQYDGYQHGVRPGGPCTSALHLLTDHEG
ncbi:hypothetical protein D3C77_672570 [compost metagenome]